jgi:integrase/recombinase XerC
MAFYKDLLLLFEQFLSIKISSKNTKLAYFNDIKIFTEYLYKNNVKIKKITQKDVINFIIYRKNDDLDNRSICRFLSSMKLFSLFLMENSYIEEGVHSLICSTKMPKFKKSIPKTISHDEFLVLTKAIIEMKNREEWQNKRDVAISYVIYSMGLRISEALSIQIKDFIDKDGTVVMGKGSKERYVPILDKVSEIVNDYIKSCPFEIEDCLFVSNKGKKYSARLFEAVIEIARNLSNLSEYVTPHTLRHACATGLLNNGGSIKSIQQLLGHANLSTTQIYTKVSNSVMMSKYESILNKEKN